MAEIGDDHAIVLGSVADLAFGAHRIARSAELALDALLRKRARVCTRRR